MRRRKAAAFLGFFHIGKFRLTPSLAAPALSRSLASVCHVPEASAQGRGGGVCYAR